MFRIFGQEGKNNGQCKSKDQNFKGTYYKNTEDSDILAIAKA